MTRLPATRPGRLTRAGLLLGALLLVGRAQITPGPFLGFERLANGNTLICVNSNPVVPFNDRVIEVDSLGQVVWAYLGGGIGNVHTGRRLSNGNTLITGTKDQRVIEVDPDGNVVWSLTTGLRYPNEAFRLANGNTLITDRMNNRVIEVNPDGTTVWVYGDLAGPHNGARLPNGNTLICDSERDRVIEVSPAGTVVWRCDRGIRWPRSAQRLVNGNTLITSSNDVRVVEVDTAGNPVWWYPTGYQPYAASRLANGHTVISVLNSIMEVDSSGQTVWQWPNTVAVCTDTFRVLNQTSGCSLYAHVHRPAWASPTNPVPGVVLVPDAVWPGTVYDTSGLADAIAADGFAVLHFDADGRGQSDSFPEDYGGPVNQDGLAACVAALEAQSFVDPSRVGILSEGYGITTASGMLARHSGSPEVSFLIDFEGPANRYQSSSDSGGPIPVPPDSNAFWSAREATRDMSQASCDYLRIQTALDHNPRISDGRGCIALIDSATEGAARWTRVNDSAMNAPNRTYTLTDPPVWIPELQENQRLTRYLLYLRELTPAGPPSAAPTPVRAGPVQRAVLTVVPIIMDRTTTICYELPCRSQAAIGVYDAGGRRVKQLAQGLAEPGEHRLGWDGSAETGRAVAPGVYFVRFASGSMVQTCKVTKE